MTDATTKKAIAIVSDSSAGRILGLRLSREGHTVTLIDTGDHFHTPSHSSFHHVPFYPATADLTLAIKNVLRLTAPETSSEISLENSSEISLGTSLHAPLEPSPEISFEHSIGALDLPPLAYEGGELKPFVGFGETKSSAVSVLSRYNHSLRLEMPDVFEEKLYDALEELKENTLNYSELTRLEFSGDSIEKLVINGSQEIFADRFVFMNSPRELLPLLPADHKTLGARTRGRIVKSPIWSRVTLQMEHSRPLYDGRNLIFLSPSQGDQDPCVGTCFIQNHGGELRYFSAWETYIDNDLNEDAEHVSSAIKNMRRMIRRTFPHLEEKPREVLSVTPEAAADYSWIFEHSDFQSVATNLVIAPTLASSYTGLARMIDSASRAHGLLSAGGAVSGP